VPEHAVEKPPGAVLPGGFLLVRRCFAEVFLIAIKTLLARCVSAQIANRLYNTVKASFGESHECSS
jgi:hypothetical protein